MRLTSPLLAAAVCALGASPALAQQAAEDWDLTTNAEQQLTLATLDFGANVLALRCRAGDLDMLVTGVPVSTGATRKVRVSAGAIAAEDQVWIAQPGQPVLGAAEPARLARQLRAGGDLDIRLDPEGPTDRSHRYRLTVPASAAAVDAVLTACGKPLDEPRDLLVRVSEPVTWSAMPIPAFPRSPAAQTAGRGRVGLSCIVSPEWGLTDCRVESETPPDADFGASALRSARDARLNPPTNGTDIRGQLLVFAMQFEPPGGR